MMNIYLCKLKIEGVDDLRMAYALRKDNESFDSLMNRFKQDCARQGLISEIKKHEYFYPPSIMRRKKRIAAAKKRRK